MGQNMTEFSSVLSTYKFSPTLNSVRSYILRPEQSSKRLAQRREISHRFLSFFKLFLFSHVIKILVSHILSERGFGSLFAIAFKMCLTRIFELNLELSSYYIMWRQQIFELKLFYMLTFPLNLLKILLNQIPMDF